MLDIDWRTLLFQIINFVVLFLVLSRYLFKPLKAKLNERNRVVSETLQNARDRENEAALLRQQREEQLEAVRVQAEEIIQNAQAEATRRSEEMLGEARERMEAMTVQMREDMTRQRDELVAGHYDDILDAVIDLSGNVVQSVTTRRTHDDLVTNFLASIYQMPQDEVEEYRGSMAGRMPTNRADFKGPNRVRCRAATARWCPFGTLRPVVQYVAET